MRNTTHKQQEIENQKAKIRLEQEKLRANKRRLQQLKNQQRIQKEIELDRSNLPNYCIRINLCYTVFISLYVYKGGRK